MHPCCFAILSARHFGWALRLTHSRPQLEERPHCHCLKPFWWYCSFDRKRLEIKQAVERQAEDKGEPDVKTNDLDKIGQNNNADTEKKKIACTIM